VQLKLKEPAEANLGVEKNGKGSNPKADPCFICKWLGHWAKACNQRKKPATKQAEVKTVSGLLVSPVRIHIAVVAALFDEVIFPCTTWSSNL